MLEGLSRAWVMLAVGVLAALMVGHGLGAGALGPLELGRQPGGPLDILAAALDPASTEGGHMPLSWWMRWACVDLWGLEGPAAWRLHAAAGIVVAACLTCLLQARRGRLWPGLLAGSLLAIHPLAVLHGQQSSAAAWAMVAGALTLMGLAGLYEGDRRGPHLLAAALVVGVANDLWFLLMLSVALGACVWVLQRAWDRDAALVRIREALVPVALVIGPSLVLFAFRLGRTGQPAGQVLDGSAGIARVLVDLPDAFLHGWAETATVDPWRTGLAVVVFVGSGVVAILRGQGPLPRMAGALMLGFLGAVLVTAWLHGAPMPGEVLGPAAYAAVLPAFVIALVGGWRGLPRPLGVGLGLAFTILILDGTLRHHAEPPGLRASLWGELAAQSDDQQRWVVPSWMVDELWPYAGEADVVDCVDGTQARIDTLHWVHEGTLRPSGPPRCDNPVPAAQGRDWGMLGLAVDGVTVHTVGRRRGPDAVGTLHHVRMVRPDGAVASAPLQVEVAGGGGGAEGELRLEPESGEAVRGGLDAALALPLAPGSSARVIAGPTNQGERGVLLGWVGRPWIKRRVDALPAGGQHRWVLHLPSGESPARRALRRLALLGMLAMMAGAALWSRYR